MTDIRMPNLFLVESFSLNNTVAIIVLNRTTPTLFTGMTVELLSLYCCNTRINSQMETLKGFNVGTPEYKKLEAEVAKAQGDFSVNAQLQKKDFMDREAKVYLQVYNEIERAVSQFARDNGIAVVHRFDGDPVDSADRNRILGSITKPIVYYDAGYDITPDIVKILNGTTVADQGGRAGVPPQRTR